MEGNSLITYKPAAETIKAAILQGQYEAAKGVNRVQLAVYYGIGKYISLNSRKGVWGKGALDAISQILRKDLPGLRGYSETNLKNMRLFYEAWMMLDAKSSVATDEIQTIDNQDGNNSSVTTDELGNNSTIAIVELQAYTINVYQAIKIPDMKDFPVESFFNVPFTHHLTIIEKTKNIHARYYYIHRTAEENLSVKALEKLIKDDAYGHRDSMPSNFTHTIPDRRMARKAVMMFKDSYLLDFINVEQIGEREAIDVDERVVEQQIVQNVKQFIMTFGRDFAFIGNQYHLEVYGVEHFPDLLFFNRELNAMICFELLCCAQHKRTYVA